MGGFSFDDSLKLSDPHDESVVASDETLRHGSEGLARIQRNPVVNVADATGTQFGKPIRPNPSLSIDKEAGKLADDVADMGMTATNIVGLGIPSSIDEYERQHESLRKTGGVIPQGVKDVAGTVAGVLVGAKGAKEVGAAGEGVMARRALNKQVEAKVPTPEQFMSNVKMFPEEAAGLSKAARTKVRSEIKSGDYSRIMPKPEAVERAVKYEQVHAREYAPRLDPNAKFDSPSGTPMSRLTSDEKILIGSTATGATVLGGAIAADNMKKKKK